MKYMVHFQVSLEAGREIESRPGGPGPVVSRLFGRFKPEQSYFATSRRECWWVVDLETPSDMAELMIAITNIAGSYPNVTPVVSGAEFGSVVEKALPAAKKLVEG